MEEWLIVKKKSHEPLNENIYASYHDAQKFIERMGETFEDTYQPYYVTDDVRVSKIVNEGLVKGDLEDIMLPRISIDEYVPSDPGTDHVVVALFIKGVPEAVLPLSNFCNKCDGVIDVDYGDSETIPNTSIVYVEYERESLKVQHIFDLVAQISMLTNIKPEDFTFTFPHTNKKFPFEPETLVRYFRSRNLEKNIQAQKKAEKKAQEKEQEKLNTTKQQPEQEQEMSNESLIEALVDLIGNDDETFKRL